ncbi:alpha-pore-forming tripartite toxin MakABE regulator [Thalassotalea ganghwensis]
MKKIEILIVVDSAGALASNNLASNVYMVDSNQWLGSWQEGTCQLHTVTEDGQFIAWSSCAISPDDEVTITGFTGDMVNQSVCKPQSVDEDAWEGQIQTRGASGRYPYTISLSINGKNMNFSPYMEVQ